MAISLSQCCDYSMKLYYVHAFNIYLFARIAFAIGKQKSLCFIQARNFSNLHLQKSLIGYPYNLDFNYGALAQLQHFSINNLGDPFIESNYGVHSRQFEVGVLDWFARLCELEKNEYWGYITNCGTEENLHGIFIGLVTINLSFLSFQFEIVETNCCPCKESNIQIHFTEGKCLQMGFWMPHVNHIIRSSKQHRCTGWNA